MISDIDKQIMVKTARSNGAIGKNAILPKFISEIPALKPHLILDFGCGKDAVHVKLLREQGFEFVYGIDLIPLNEYTYDFPFPLSVPWHLVYASNVLNVQPSIKVLECTLSVLSDYARHGVAYLSYPKSPRKLNYSVEQMYLTLHPFFKSVCHFKYHNTTIFKCVGKFCQIYLEKRLTV